MSIKYEIYKIYKDAGISAKTGNKRPTFEELLQDIRDKKYDDFINDLFNENILDENEIDIIQNNSKNKDDFDSYL